jgi:hypothetical protein
MSFAGADAKWLKVALGCPHGGYLLVRALAALLLSSLVFGFALPEDDGKPEHNPGIAGQRDGDGLPLVPKLHWGMTQAEIQRAFPDVGEHWTRVASDTPNHRELEIAHYDIEGCRFRLDLDFFNQSRDELVELDATPEAPDMEECLGHVRARFLDRFGPHPWQDDEGGYAGGMKISDETRIVWSGKVTTIWFQISDDLKTGKRRFWITLQHAGAPGTFIQ